MENGYLSKSKASQLSSSTSPISFLRLRIFASHDDGPVGDGDLEGYNIVCPRHGGEFDVRTGKAVQLPVVVDVPAYPVKVMDGMIQVGIPKE